MTLITVCCPVCDGTAFSVVYPATVRDAALDPSSYFGSARVSAGHLAVVRCRRCAMQLTNPQDDPRLLANVYAAWRDEAYEREHANRRTMAMEHLALVARYQDTRARLLDVGCASGSFVGVAHETGWKATGVDPSEWMIACARARYPGVTFHVGRLDDIPTSMTTFEVITLWDVLEHLPSPLATLTQIRRRLAPGGWLFLSVPNVASLTARVMAKRWVLLLREHLWYFSPISLRDLLARAGLEVVETRPKFARFSLATVLDRIAQYPGKASAWCGTLARVSTFRRVSLGFPMGEMRVVARARESR